MRYICLMLFTALGCSTEPLNDRDLMRPDVGEKPDGGAPIAEDVSDRTDADAFELAVGPLCRPNHDGLIERSEVTLEPGLTAKFATATDVSWTTRATDVDGTPTWDLADELPGDRDVLVELRDPRGAWFEPTFPDADYYTPLGAVSDLLGVFRVTDDAVLLVGVATPEDGLFATELEYDPPVPVLQFPLEVGDSWQVESTVTGLFQGVFSVYTETYAFEVDEAGTLLTPFGMFDVMRVRSLLEREVGILTTVLRSFAFVSECFGTVATVSSQENEDAVEFSEVSELRRLTP